MDNQTVEVGPVLHNTCESYVAGVYLETQRSGTHVTAHYVLDYILLPLICIFGILGNVLNLFILSRKHINASLDRMERSVYMGLIALAVSDLLQCCLFLTYLFRLPEYINPVTFLQSVHMFFVAHQVALINIVLFSSTWLTVLMAVGRYIAICHPINARSFVKLKVTSILIAGIFVTSICVSLPYFFEFEYQEYPCIVIAFGKMEPPSGADCNCTVSIRVPMQRDFIQKYNIFWILVEFVVPLVIMVFCNIYLIMSLKQSYRMQREYRATQVRDPSLYITPTLVAVIVFFIIFIAPVEILKLMTEHLNAISTEHSKTIKSLSNIMQCLNAAVNFILYCVINVHFRKTIRKMLCCKESGRRVVGSMRSDQIRTNHTTITYNMSEAETEL